MSFVITVPFGPLKGLKQYISLRHGLKKVLGFYEPPICRALEKIVKEGDVCVDVGCHVGYISLFLRRLCGNSGKVYSFDPIKEDCDHLKKSISINNFKNMHCLNYALGEKSSKKFAHVFSDSGMANFFDSGFVNYQKVNQTEFEVKRLDEFVKEADFIKIDTEGYELNVLKGSLGCLKKFKPSLLMEIHVLEQLPEIKKLLQSFDYGFLDLDFQEFKEQGVHLCPFHLIALPK